MEGVSIKQFNTGGLADSKYQGRENSLASLVGIDVHSEPGIFTAHQGLKKDSGATVTALVKNIVVCSTGDTYHFSSTDGKIWKRTSAGTWSLQDTTVPTSGSAGCLGAEEYSGHIYWATQNYLHRIAISGLDDWAANSEENWAEMHLDQPEDGEADDTYDVATSVSETEPHMRTFVPRTTSISSIFINVDTKGTGNWTVALHDVDNNVIGTKTIAAGSMDTGELEFAFAAAVNVVVGETYHIHVTSTVADGILASHEYYAATGSLNAASDYPLGTAVSESDVDRREFVATNEYLTGIQLYVKTKGTGNWTVTLHDSDNNSLATSTIATGSLSDTTTTDFTFGTAASGLTVGGTYHFHVHSTVADGYAGSHEDDDLSWAIMTPLTNDIEDCWIKVYGTGDSEFHPMMIQNQVLYIGDRNFVHQVEDTTYSSQAIDLPIEYRVKCLGKYITDLLIGTVVDSTRNKAIIFRWNTWSVSWSSEDEVDEVGINAFIPVDNYVFVQAGVNGNVYYYDGSQLKLLQGIPGSYTTAAYGKVNPSATASFRGMPLIGMSNGAGNPTKQGVYSFGTKNPSLYPRIFALDYLISTGKESGVEIGAMAVIGNDLLVSWKDTTGGTTYGVDVIDASNKFDTAYIETRAMLPSRMHETTWSRIVVGYSSLPADTDIDIYVKENYAAAWGDKLTTNKDTTRKLIYSEKRLSNCVMEIKLVLQTNSNDSPKVDYIFVEAG